MGGYYFGKYYLECTKIVPAMVVGLQPPVRLSCFLYIHIELASYFFAQKPLQRKVQHFSVPTFSSIKA